MDTVTRKKDWVTYKTCKHPDFVKVGKHSIYVKGFRDFTANDCDAIAKLDVFIALTKSFDVYETLAPPKYKNALLNELAKTWYQLKADNVPDNIIVMEVPDYSIDNHIVLVVEALLNAGKRIGFGCYGAHGRTGWLLARLLKTYEGMTGDQAVRAVRERLCSECIESASQTKDLGCKEESLRKTEVTTYGGYGSYGSKYGGSSYQTYRADDYKDDYWKKYPLATEKDYVKSIDYYDDIPGKDTLKAQKEDDRVRRVSDDDWDYS